MISVQVDGVWFNFRAAAVIIDDGHVLLHRATYDTIWSLPGGRVEAGEASAATLARELVEELGAEVNAQVGRLLWVVENFFEYEGQRFHELGMYYEVALAPTSPYLEKSQVYDGVEEDMPLHNGERIHLIFQWFPLAALPDVLLYPTFLRERLRALPATTEPVMHVDG